MESNEYKQIDSSVLFKKVERYAATEVVLEQIKGLILGQKLQSGDKLPSERVLAEIIGVSRPSIRESLRTLEALGIIEIRHGSGAYLKEPGFGFADFPMTVLLSREKDVINELIEAREIIEVQIVALAIQRATDKDIERLEAFWKERCTPVEVKRLEGEYNYDFETLIGEIVGNRILLTIQKATHTLWEITLKRICVKPLPVDIINEDHLNIIKAIKNRDEEAGKKAIKYHLRALLRQMEG